MRSLRACTRWVNNMNASGEERIASLREGFIGDHDFRAVYAALPEAKRAQAKIELHLHEYTNMIVEPDKICITDLWTGKHAADADELLGFLRRHNALQMHSGAEDLRLSVQYLFPESNAVFVDGQYLPQYEGDEAEDERRANAFRERYLAGEHV